MNPRPHARRDDAARARPSGLAFRLVRRALEPGLFQFASDGTPGDGLEVLRPEAAPAAAPGPDPGPQDAARTSTD